MSQEIENAMPNNDLREGFPKDNKKQKSPGMPNQIVDSDQEELGKKNFSEDEDSKDIGVKRQPEERFPGADEDDDENEKRDKRNYLESSDRI